MISINYLIFADSNLGAEGVQDGLICDTNCLARAIPGCRFELLLEGGQYLWLPPFPYIREGGNGSWVSWSTRAREKEMLSV